MPRGLDRRLTAAKLVELLKNQQEFPGVDFKYDSFATDNEYNNPELLKDILAMLNTADGRVIDQSAYIIIGIRDPKAVTGPADIFNANLDIARLSRCLSSEELPKYYNPFLQSERKYDPLTDPILPPIYSGELRLDYIEINGHGFRDVKLWVIEITPSPYIHKTTKELRPRRNQSFPAGSIFFRDNSTTRTADAHQARVLLEKKEALWKSLNVLQAPLRALRFLESVTQWLALEFSRRQGSPDIQTHYIDRQSRTVTESEQADAADLASSPTGILVAEKGLGKSSQLLQKAWTSAQKAIEELSKPAPDPTLVQIPIYVEGKWLVRARRDPATQHLSLNALLADILTERSDSQRDPLLASWVRGQLDSGRGLVVIDGFDEVALADREWLTSTIQALLSANPACPLWIGSRPEAVDSTLRGMVGQVFELLPLNNWKKTIWRWYPPQSAQSIVQSLRQLEGLEELWGNPLFLRLAAEVIRTHVQAGLSRRTDLYSAMIGEMRQTWVAKMHPGPGLQIRFVPFLGQVALQIHLASKQDPTIDIADRLAHFASTAASASDFATHEPNRDLINDLVVCGLFVRDGSGGYEPVHPSLILFLAAGAIAKLPQPVAQVSDSLAEPQTISLLWMLAGQLTGAAYLALITALVTTAKSLFDTPNRDAADRQAETLTEALCDCLYEAKEGTAEQPDEAFVLITRLLDSTQRRDRKRAQGQWECLMERSLVVRALIGVERAGGYAARAEAAEVRAWLAQYLSSMQHQPADPPADPSKLSDGLASDNAVVRWVALWLAVSLECRTRTLTDSLFAEVTRLASADPCDYVQGCATRALAHLWDVPRALRALAAALESETPARVMAACYGLSQIQVPESFAMLQAFTERVLNAPTAENDPVLGRSLVSALGAIEHVVQVQIYGKKRELNKLAEYSHIELSQAQDKQLASLLLRALRHPHPRVSGSAASALGKLRYLPAWDALTNLAQERNAWSGRRASAMFAIQQLCAELPEERWPSAIKWLVPYISNPELPPEVRSPAISAIGWLAGRGYRRNSDSRRIINRLITLLQGRELPALRRSAAFALVRFRIEGADQQSLILPFMQKTDRNQQIAAELIIEQAGRYRKLYSINLLGWLLAIEALRPSLLLRVIGGLFYLNNQYREEHRGSSPPEIRTLVDRLRILSSAAEDEVAQAARTLIRQIR